MMSVATSASPAASGGNRSQQVSSAIVQRIVSRGLRAGDSLGTELSLLEDFAVSRPTLRESIRRLEAQGIVSVKPGPGGGVLVGHPDTQQLAQAFSIFLFLNEVPFSMVLRARELIEPTLAYEAATHGSDDEFDMLEESVERLRQCSDEAEFLAENRRFHALIAQAGNNAVLESFWHAISLVAAGEQQGTRFSSRNRARVAEAHADIVDACRRRDPDGAARLMAGHIGELAPLVRAQDSAADTLTPMRLRSLGIEN